MTAVLGAVKAGAAVGLWDDSGKRRPSLTASARDVVATAVGRRNGRRVEQRNGGSTRGAGLRVIAALGAWFWPRRATGNDRVDENEQLPGQAMSARLCPFRLRSAVVKGDELRFPAKDAGRDAV